MSQDRVVVPVLFPPQHVSQYGVVVPVLFSQIHRLLPRLVQLSGYFCSKKQLFILAVNGCAPEELEAFLEKFNLDLPHLFILCTGRDRNPYRARNVALEYAFVVARVPAVLLTDADCLPSDEGDVDGVMSNLTNLDGMVSGVVSTEVPTGTKHFNLLQGFECYKGFTLPGTCVGAAMAFTRRVYESIGPMKEDNVSGGDAEYALRWTRTSTEAVAQDERLHLVKRIDTLTFAGVLEKQIRRGRMADPSLTPPLGVLKGRAVALLRAQLAALDSCSPLDDRDTYMRFMDTLFGLTFTYGQMAQLMDVPDAHPVAPRHPPHHDGVVKLL